MHLASSRKTAEAKWQKKKNQNNDEIETKKYVARPFLFTNSKYKLKMELLNIFYLFVTGIQL